MARAEELLIGRTIAGKFAIEAHIGSGAMGQVYRARQIALEKTVALKVLHQDLATDETFAARFHREAMAASRLDHPNSMRVLDFGAEPDGMLYIAMEYLDGRDLHHILHEEGALPAGRAADILMQALAALVVAHDMGVIHRDLKPENIMVLDGVDDEGKRVDVVKVCDFGIAKINNAHTFAGSGSSPARGPLTTQGLVVGTPEYMSPEQGRGDTLDLRSDLYSVGVILFQLITGKLPFTAETALGIVFKQVNEPPPRPSLMLPGIEPELEAICLKALAKRPQDRYQSAREMRASLRPFAGGVSARIPSAPSTIPRPLDPDMEHAETLSVPVGPSTGAGSFNVRDVELQHEHIELPVTRTSVWGLGGGAVLVGAIVALLVWTQWLRPVAAVQPPEVADTVAVDAAAAPVASATAAAPVASASLPATAASARTSAIPPKPARTASQASTPPLAAEPAAETRGGGFSLATCSASPSVTRATGVAGADVRHALNSWKLTECYRAALQKTNRALDGHVILELTIAPSGAVSKVLSRGPGPLMTNVGDCMTDAVAHASVANAGSGGTAEVDIACTPR